MSKTKTKQKQVQLPTIGLGTYVCHRNTCGKIIGFMGPTLEQRQAGFFVGLKFDGGSSLWLNQAKSYQYLVDQNGDVTIK